MYPLFREGDIVDVDEEAYVHALPRPGDIVLAHHPFKRDVVMLKRVDHITSEGRVFLVGDNRLESSDSRSFGALPPARLIGRVLGKAKPQDELQ